MLLSWVLVRRLGSYFVLSLICFCVSQLKIVETSCLAYDTSSVMLFVSRPWL